MVVSSLLYGTVCEGWEIQRVLSRTLFLSLSLSEIGNRSGSESGSEESVGRGHRENRLPICTNALDSVSQRGERTKKGQKKPRLRFPVKLPHFSLLLEESSGSRTNTGGYSTSQRRTIPPHLFSPVFFTLFTRVRSNKEFNWIIRITMNGASTKIP